MLNMIFDETLVPKENPFTKVEASKNCVAAFNTEFLLHPIAREIIQDIDKSEVISPNNILSPVLGSISPERLSGGSKALMLAYFYDFTICTLNIGDKPVQQLTILVNSKAIMKFHNRFNSFYA